MNIQKGLLVKCIAIPLLVGAASSLISGGGMEMFQSVVKPPLSPPGWLFPVIWTILYTLMGISSYLILTSGVDPEQIQEAITIYGYQLAVNFFWSIFFFNLEWYLFSFFWLLLLWALVWVMIRLFWKISRGAAYLNVPYLVWLTIAGYLNFGIWILNR